MKSLLDIQHIHDIYNDVINNGSMNLKLIVTLYSSNILINFLIGFSRKNRSSSRGSS